MLGMIILRNDRERQRANQAAHVAVWERGGSQPLLSGSVEDRGAYVVTVHNQSQQPVTAPTVVARIASAQVLKQRVGHKRIPSDWLIFDEAVDPADTGVVIAIADSFKGAEGASLSHIPPGAIVEHSVSLQLPRPCYDIAVSFRDAAGKPWTRDASTGELTLARQRNSRNFARRPPGLRRSN